MNGVIALGRHAGPFLDQPIHAVHVDPQVVLGDLSVMHTMLTQQLAVQGPLVVIYPARLGDAPAKALSTVRTALDGAPILWHATTLPPLAADVLVTLAAALHGPLGGSAVVSAALALLERQIVHLTWLSRVSGLTEPAPTVWQHAQSALPHTSWLVSSWPQPTIRRLALDDPPPVPRPSQEVGVVLADLDGDVSWVSPVVTRRLAQAVGLEVPPPTDTAAWWGAKRVTQVVLYPRSVDLLAAALRPHLDPGSCSWCRRMVGSEICPWCGLPRNGLTRLDEGRRAEGLDEVFIDGVADMGDGRHGVAEHGEAMSE
ncbi:MAG TPA: hypothetical protein VMM13_11545 [Euzebya sp.]|nr:hypothetical protein [Euzebya sp.]